MPSVLIVGPEERAAVAAVMEYAARPENYWVGKGLAPGQKPEHCVLLGLVRAVYSVDVLPVANPQVPSGMIRHLSISSLTAPKGKALHPIAVYEVAMLFGFTAPDEHFSGDFPLDWAMKLVEGERVIEVGQAIP
jgi:hypothetical protein